MGINDLLKRGAKQNVKPAKSKSNTPVIKLGEDEELVKAHKDWRSAKTAEVDANTRRKQAEEVLKPAAISAADDLCRREGKHFSAVKVQAGNEPPVTLVTQNKYSAIDSDSGDKLRAIFGGKFDQCFSQITEIGLSPLAMQRIEELIPKLMDAVSKRGDDQQTKEAKFFELFSIKQFYKPTSYLHETRRFDPELRKKFEQAEGEKLVKMTTPFFRS